MNIYNKQVKLMQHRLTKMHLFVCMYSFKTVLNRLF